MALFSANRRLPVSDVFPAADVAHELPNANMLAHTTILRTNRIVLFLLTIIHTPEKNSNCPTTKDPCLEKHVVAGCRVNQNKVGRLRRLPPLV
ncbi:hypothetical protein DESC_600130 [Desulfosarcina cetonica]|nr:hypothetical protein DESC_600130 [Desulfosarcina cetonica]